MIGRLHELGSILAGPGMSETSARAAALAVVDRAASDQALTMAHDDAYLLAGMIFVVLIPSVFLFKRRGS